ncbi:uncharacterized protein LOC108212162 [Daucus carota subsp. sativus]|uniref:uncharacterized protein LOC108212162 n=1 Tax=Daucus carota subsp. sativus TaxID=79200 RepID=UPI0007B24A76|nr:PREDICTED: uncharacterized protein LOC108212162 [Daucus carota subsp. sativus]
MIVFNGWELWACILLSLFLQIFLTIAGTFRRLASRRWFVKILWLAYLLADFVAVLGLGLLVSRQSLLYNNCLNEKHCYTDEALMYWATFFLVHLGGPDNITAFSTVDNELWLRDLFSISSKCITVAYAIYESVRTSSKVRLVSDMNKVDLSKTEVLQYALVYSTAFKGLVVDLSVSISQRNQSREFFLQRSIEQAFRLVELELDYLYDVLFTKILVLHHKVGLSCRILSFIAVVSSFVLFYFDFVASPLPPSDIATPEFHKIDIVVTCILFIGAILMEVIAFFMLLFCDWTVVKLSPLSDANSNRQSWKDKLLACILSYKHTISAFFHHCLYLVGIENQREIRITERWWANSFSAFNLIYHCLHGGRQNIYPRLVKFLMEFLYAEPYALSGHLATFIFDQLKMKSKKAESLAIAKQIYSSRGEWVLDELEDGCQAFLPYVAKYDYEDILLLWHIATEVCYNDNQDKVTNQEQRRTAKDLSDYMLYLMVMKPDMMYGVSSNGEIKFRETCTEVSKFFDTELPELKNRQFSYTYRGEREEALQKIACQRILFHETEAEHVTVCRDVPTLFTASELAKELNKLPSEEKWLLISKLWVELLSYAATHIRSSAHAEQLSKGGELITVVWLLMAHFGLGDH